MKCEGDGLYKCKDCFGCQLLCRSCFAERHALLPFHRALVCHFKLSPDYYYTHVSYSTGWAVISKTSDSNHLASMFTWAMAANPAASLGPSLKTSPLSIQVASTSWMSSFVAAMPNLAALIVRYNYCERDFFQQRICDPKPPSPSICLICFTSLHYKVRYQCMTTSIPLFANRTTLADTITRCVTCSYFFLERRIELL